MSSEVLPLDTYLAILEQAATGILARHGWRLLAKAELVAQAALLLPSECMPTPGDAEHACLQVYAQHLYVAARDPARQELAYGELHAYLYRIALRQRPHIAQDAAQEAILLVHKKLETCRTPAAFLKFAIYQLLTAFHRLTPSASESSLDGWLSDTDKESEDFSPIANAVDPTAEVAERLQAVNLLGWLRAVIEANPRAKKQILAVALKYLEGYDDEAIAKTLATTIANVHVLRSRGLDQLRQEYQKRPPHLQDF